MKKKAEMGIGTLILFIAMILVAAIAAGVLVRTATSLQSKALLTGERSKEQVSTSLETAMLFAENATGDNQIDEFYQKIRLVPGSGGVKFNELTVQIITDTNKAKINFGSGTCVRDTGFTSGGSSGFWTANGTGYYTVEYLEQGALYKSGYLQRGDFVKVCYQTPKSIGEDDSVIVSLIPKVGNVHTLDLAMPGVMTTEKVFLYP